MFSLAIVTGWGVGPTKMSLSKSENLYGHPTQAYFFKVGVYKYDSINCVSQVYNMVTPINIHIKQFGYIQLHPLIQGS